MRKLSILFVFCVLILVGCSTSQSDKPQVVTTAYPIYSIVNQVAGDYVDVEMIYPVGSDPHSYELTSSDMVKVAESDMFFYVSDSYEFWVSDFLKSGEYKTTPINITENELFKSSVDPQLYGISQHTDEHAHEEVHPGEEHTEEHAHEEVHPGEEHTEKHEEEEAHLNEEHAHEEVHPGEEHTEEHEEEEANLSEDHQEQDAVTILDPHIWMSPKLMNTVVDVITEQLSILQPDQASTFTTNANTIKTDLDQIDSDLTKLAASITVPVVVAHDAYSYLELDYGIDFIPLYGMHHDDEPTSKQIADLTALITEKDISTIYNEQNDDNAIINQIAQETGVAVDILYNAESPTQEQFDQAVTYQEIMQLNIEQLTKLVK